MKDEVFGFEQSPSHTPGLLRMLLVRGLGLRSAHNLLRHYETPERLFATSQTELAQWLPSDVANDLLSSRSSDRAQAELERARELSIRLVAIHDPGYPALLREIFDPPLILYVRGERWNPEPQVAVVGTRRPTGYGINCAERIAEDLAARGIVVTSGLARGIDSAAHRGALRSGTTCAVFGSGLDFIYPRENRKLADFVEKNGAIVSEFPLGTPPSPENFPIRNRIISGMSLGVVVVEAAEYSGSLITARLAIDAGREVFAIPGNIIWPNSFGPHALIRQGAKLVTNWQDIVEELPYAVREKILAPLMAKVNDTPQPQLDGNESAVWNALALDDARSIDTLLTGLSLAPSDVYDALFHLELRDLVRQLPGKKYVKRM